MSESEDVRYELVEVQEEASALEVISKAEIDTAIATAKRYPRSIKKFQQEAMSLATLDEDTAKSCIYALPREGKVIRGESVRLAEIIGASYGNLRYAARVVQETAHTVVAQGICFDLERNISASVEVSRRIVDKHGRRYSRDMIEMTKNAACSIALRNAIFRVVPKALVKPIYDAARRVAIGDASTLSERRMKAIEAFAKMGIFEDRLLAKLEVPSVEDIGLEHLEVLVGLYNAIRDGTTTIDEAFPEPEPDANKTNGAASKAEALAQKFKARSARRKKSRPATGRRPKSAQPEVPVKQQLDEVDQQVLDMEM